MICTACFKKYKNKSSLQAHQRTRCKTFLLRKQSKQHLNPFYTSCLLHLDPNIADIISQYVGEYKPKKIVDLVTQFDEITIWFKRNARLIPLISKRSVIYLLNEICMHLNKMFPKHVLNEYLYNDNSTHHNQALENPTIKQDFRIQLEDLTQVLHQLKTSSRMSKRYVFVNHCDNVSKWCQAVMNDYELLKF